MTLLSRRILTGPALLCIAGFAWLGAGSAAPAPAQDHIISVNFEGRSIGGRALAKTKDQLFLLGRDGRLWYFTRDQVGRTYKSETQFTSYSTDELRRSLAAEFGRRFEVSGSGYFLVVHPVGGRSVWPRRFDDLYRAFVHYFSARGWRPPTPQFPLVAIVFHDQDEFRHYARSTGDEISTQVLGYYSPATNRVALYDQGQGSDGEEDWERNAATIVHEAAHQSAFNLGIHNRFAPPSRWVTEGLGTMFEAPGVWNSFRNPQLAARVNRQQLTQYRRFLNQGFESGKLVDLLSSDRMFETEPANAYALAWALSFYLAETQSRNYITYLQRTAERENFTLYRSTDRLEDFTRVFGENLQLMESRLLRYMEQLP